LSFKVKNGIIGISFLYLKQNELLKKAGKRGLIFVSMGLRISKVKIRNTCAITSLWNSVGFTLIELMVVISIMGLMLSLIIWNSSTEKSSRSLKIAQTELATNLRKIQSYALSSRNLPNGQVVQYYVAKFDSASPSSYTLQAIYDVNSTSSNPTKVDVETISLPKGVVFSPSNPFVIGRTTLPATTNAPSCILIAYQLPYARTFINEGCSFNNFNTSPPDSYRYLLNYVQNVDLYPTVSDSNVTITLQNTITGNQKVIDVRGLTGLIKEN
jgi:prepilin-type N-terminal cleavage/methylation domain-containing protein